MEHDAARRLMAEAMEGKITSDDERELALHLVGCPECKSVYEGIQKAHPALESIELGHASKESIDAAVHRAATVMRGEADPGPFGLTEEPPRLPDVPDTETIRIDTSTSAEDQLVPAGPFVATGPMQTYDPASAELPTHVRPIETEPPQQVPVDVPAIDEDALDVPVAEAPAVEVEQVRIIEDAPPAGEAPSFDEPVAPVLPVEVPEAPPADIVTEQPPVAETEVLSSEPRGEIERLLEEDRTRFEPLAVEEIEEREPMGPGPWLIAIAVTVVLAVLAAMIVTRGGGIFGGGDLPSADTVRSSVGRAFADMKSLKATFQIQKLNLYRVGQEDDSLVYRFANGTYSGSIDYDRAEGYKQDIALDVGNDEIERAEIVQTSDETRSLLGTGDKRSVLVETNPPLGPPDGSFRPTFGVLESSLGVAARILMDVDEITVAGVTERDGRELYEVRANVEPTELTRADRIEAALDANTYMPVIVKRSISRQNARVLAPSSALGDADLDRAFSDNERLTTELIELDGVQYDEIVLPGDLTLDPPEGAEEQTRDSKFERVQRPELASKLDFEPLLPRSLPDGYEEQLLAVYTGEPQKWGPNKSLPEPQSVFQSNYFDGKTTIVVTQRRFEQRFDLRSSPLQAGGIPITAESVERDNKQFFYGHSPELPPHVYGFMGNVFVMASGYATQSELLQIVAALTETPVEVPSLDASPSPGASPGASPAASPTGSPAASPAGSAAATTAP